MPGYTIFTTLQQDVGRTFRAEKDTEVAYDDIDMSGIRTFLKILEAVVDVCTSP